MILIHICCVVVCFVILAKLLVYHGDSSNNKKYYVEKVFHYKGYTCVVVLHRFGHRCGYVGVPKGHAAYGMHYDDLDVSVHGGLTYSNDSDEPYPIDTDKDLWWFGFDCAHCFDGRDYQAVYRHIPLCRDEIKHLQECDLQYPDDSLTVRTTRYVVKQCKQLVKQLIELE